jgi:hypothetical protein
MSKGPTQIALSLMRIAGLSRVVLEVPAKCPNLGTWSALSSEILFAGSGTLEIALAANFDCDYKGYIEITCIGPCSTYSASQGGVPVGTAVGGRHRAERASIHP